VKAGKEKQRREVGGMEVERSVREEAIAGHASEIGKLKAAKQKSEDDLKRSAEVNETQKREL
jgi:hypothetical protein